MKIVIADDSSLWRDRIKSLLIEINEVFVVSEAENGTDALQIIMEKEPDLAILDIRMPEMNGIELLKKIRELKMKLKYACSQITLILNTKRDVLRQELIIFSAKPKILKRLKL